MSALTEEIKLALDRDEKVGCGDMARMLAPSRGCLKAFLREAIEKIDKLSTENERLREVIEAAVRIKDLWTLKEVESMFEDEAKALQLMLGGFEQALKG